ncbi:hypothetical protein EVAR_83823_1 [Eumeta japonica]|uniref:Uncharacterized protein n=1 Tax=Eumeta variegata TaxID=151549 RepID=A0A4C1WIC9_EUMVA|nr:hypothetical protein EVAR_83823_1 [Eumeta japonica]
MLESEKLIVVGPGVFECKENEIQQILMADNSDEEDELLLDEDQRRLTRDDDEDIIDEVIEDTTLQLTPVTEAQYNHQLKFK